MYLVRLQKQSGPNWRAASNTATTVFVKLMEDLSYSDVNRLKYLNAILLTELTISYSDMDRLKYLNVILMNKFKEAIQTEDNNEIRNLEVSHNSTIDHDLDDETIIDVSSDSEIQIPIESENENESQEEFDSPINEESKCDYCDKSFSQESDLRKHIHTFHEGQKEYKCESCSKSFSQARNLKKHIHTVHEGHKDYNCESV